MPLQNVRNPAKPNLKNGSKHFHDPSWRSSLEISIYELWRKELWDYRFWSKQNGDQKAESFEWNKAKFRQSRHGSFEWNIFLRYLSKFSDIWHFTICEIRRENCRDMLPIRNENFSSSQCKQLMNMHEICANKCAVQNLLPLSELFKDGRCRSRYLYMRSMF